MLKCYSYISKFEVFLSEVYKQLMIFVRSEIFWGQLRTLFVPGFLVWVFSLVLFLV